MKQPRLEIDLKPQLTAETMGKRAATLHHASDWFRAWKLSAGAIALLETTFPNDHNDREQTIRRLKNFSLSLRAPRPIAEAISSSGGVRWSELSADLMVQKLPGIFVAGEMIDWEAPTGGYLLQGCFSTGTRAGRAAAARQADRARSLS
jgi:predicted flavoprotein YhiN